MKKCRRCLEEKEDTFFNAHKDNKDGLQDWCRKCTNDYNNQYYLKRKEKWVGYQEKGSGKNKERECIECGKIFKSTSKKCDYCAYKAFCEVCGRQIRRRGRTSNKCLTCFNKSRSGALGSNWRGGKTKTSNGYIYVKCSLHPRSHNGYVLEHILVMEEYLGRFVEISESIHHKNGCKDDNRIENLELWSSTHHSGQRVSDMIIFCKEYLEKYGDDPSKY